METNTILLWYVPEYLLNNAILGHDQGSCDRTANEMRELSENTSGTVTIA